ncbi:MAG: LysR family transcriptional regulator [Myxococcales bacterium]|nr:LysR family transcriptional regulator [Myxococcales bacterium]
MLDRLRHRAWNWLPTFLEIAERGSIGRAAAALHVTPAAVSRTLRLLEGELAQPLFARVGRTLVLNRAGAALRYALRGAVVAVDRGLSEVAGDPFAGPLRVASLGVVTEELVVPALAALKVAHPDLLPEHVNVGAAEANALLARGQLDLACYYEDPSVDGLVVDRLGDLGAAVYCGRGHPLWSARRVRRDDVLAHAFSVPQVGDTGRVLDGWPADWPRHVGMRITTLRSNLEVCRSGALLTVLPDVTAAPLVRAGELRPVRFDALPRIPVYAARTGADLARPAVLAVIDAVRARIAAAGRTAARRPSLATPRSRRYHPRSGRK